MLDTPRMDNTRNLGPSKKTSSSRAPKRERRIHFERYGFNILALGLRIPLCVECFDTVEKLQFGTLDSELGTGAKCCHQICLKVEKCFLIWQHCLTFLLRFIGCWFTMAHKHYTRPLVKLLFGLIRLTIWVQVKHTALKQSTFNQFNISNDPGYLSLSSGLSREH